MERAVVTLEPDSVIEASDLPFLNDEVGGGTARTLTDLFMLDEDYHSARDHVLAEFEKSYLRHIISRAGGNVSDAARMAGVDRTTLYRLMEKHDTDKDDLLYGVDD